MKLTDLISDKDGRLSHTKLAASTGLLAMTVAFVKMAWTGTATADIFLAYGGLTLLHRFASTWLAQHFEKLTRA